MTIVSLGINILILVHRKPKRIVKITHVYDGSKRGIDDPDGKHLVGTRHGCSQPTSWSMPAW